MDVSGRVYLPPRLRGLSRARRLGALTRRINLQLVEGGLILVDAPAVGADAPAVGADVPVVGEAAAAPLVGWGLVAAVGWRPLSDGELSDPAVRAAIGRLGPLRAAAMRDWLHARARELAAHHQLFAGKGEALCLQFAALGPGWFDSLLKTPSLADFLEGEAQPVDLGKVLDEI